MTLFRERLLARLVECHAISQELVAKLVGWKHPGFSSHVGEPIAPEQKQRLEDAAAYLVRNPLSLQKLVYLDGGKAVLLPLPDEPLPRAQLRGDGPAGVAGSSQRPHPGSRAAPHALLRRVLEPRPRLRLVDSRAKGMPRRGGRRRPPPMFETNLDVEPPDRDGRGPPEGEPGSSPCLRKCCAQHAGRRRSPPVANDRTDTMGPRFPASSAVLVGPRPTLSLGESEA